MKLIAHRGNIDGPNSDTENSPDQIEKCISKGYDVEIDVWYLPQSQKFYLGHDRPDYEVSWFWLAKHNISLWIHCKNLDALERFTDTSGYNYFWHETDRYTLTSKKYIWTFPGRPYSSKSVIVMPEWNECDWDLLRVTNCYGICTDYVEKLL